MNEHWRKVMEDEIDQLLGAFPSSKEQEYH